MYEDRSTVVSDVTEIDQNKFEFVNLGELEVHGFVMWFSIDLMEALCLLLPFSLFSSASLSYF